MLDLVIIGGGPAGLATAIHATRAGLKAIVLDPRSAPIDKACGEGLLPGAIRELGGLEIELTGWPLLGIDYRDAAGRISRAQFTGLAGKGVRRTVLQSALHARAVALGVDVLPRRVGPIIQDDRGVQVAEFTARYAIGADGLHSAIRRQFKLGLPDRHPARYGLRRHFSISPWSNQVEVYWAEQAEAYVTPLAEDLIGVAILSSVRKSFEEQLRDFPELGARLPQAAAGAVRGAGPLRQRTRARTAGRVLLVGDAAGYVDALTGEGISVALASARVLVECLAKDRPQEYERAWARASRRYRLLTLGLLSAQRHPMVRRKIVPAAVALPHIFQGIVRELAR